MPTRKAKRKVENPVIVADWVGVLPEYVRWLHHAAVSGGADEYTDNHIAGFGIKDTDLMLCPTLEDYGTVYLVYKERHRHAG